MLVAVEPAAWQARVKAQGRVRAENVLVERIVVAVDVVRHLPRPIASAAHPCCGGRLAYCFASQNIVMRIAIGIGLQEYRAWK